MLDQLTVQSVQKSVMPRPLNAWERAMLERLLTEPQWPERVAVRRQLDTTFVVGRCECGCLTVDCTVLDPAGTLRVPTDRWRYVWDFDGEDADGMAMYAIVFVDDGYPGSLEVQRSDGSPFTHLPAPEAFWLSADLELLARETHG